MNNRRNSREATIRAAIRAAIRTAVLAAVLVLPIALAAGCGKPASEGGNEVRVSQWHVADAGPEDLARAAANGLPAVVKLGSDTCAPCRAMEPVMNDLAEHYAGKIAFLTVDVYKHEDLAKKYAVQVIPRIVFVNASGTGVAYVDGFQKPEQMKVLIERSGILD